ncbi:hypothetical protein PsorP6_014968 [Peronosclerospora sorghi]|uniref:Uncharacterized protein n=1 Tax=Peronosclerospora sorghi TaxID=230839 RepID=A0ACC0VU49_9STRA|nr:hypothetical protein PsorP6_014968 [Peronosclerospora sorghi]
MNRGALYTCCRKYGFNELVLAQHLDDLAESFLMSAIHNGQLRTMSKILERSARRTSDPSVRIFDLKQFAYDSRLRVINESCPECFEEPKERHRVKKKLAQEESLYPDMYNSLRRALLLLMDDASYASLEEVRARLEQAQQSCKHDPSFKQVA